MKSMGEKIRERRKAMGLTQEKLAKRVGYGTRGTLARVETGSLGVSPERLKLFAEALDTTTSYLVGETDDPARDFQMTVFESPTKGAPDADFSCVVTDNGMSGARILRGDTVNAIRTKDPEDGDVVVVLVKDVLKVRRFKRFLDRDTILLRTENPACPDEIFTGLEREKIHILGKVTSFQSETII